MSAWQLYWLFKLDDIQATCFGLGLVFLVLGGFAAGVIITECCSNWRFSSLLMPIFGLVLLITSAFIPNTKTMAAIYVVPKIVKEGDIEKFGDGMKEIATLGTECLKEILSKE